MLARRDLDQDVDKRKVSIWTAGLRIRFRLLFRLFLSWLAVIIYRCLEIILHLESLHFRQTS